jgi:hypothetical protein
MARVINAGANKSQGGVAGLPYDRVCGIATLIEKVFATDLACDEKRGEFIRATLRHDGVCERKGVSNYNVPHFKLESCLMCQLLHNVPSRGNAGLGEPLATWVFGVWISSAYLMTIKTEKRRLGLSYYQIRRET